MSFYNNIYDFTTNRFVSTYSQRGGRILNNYLLHYLIGGMDIDYSDDSNIAVPVLPTLVVPVSPTLAVPVSPTVAVPVSPTLDPVESSSSDDSFHSVQSNEPVSPINTPIPVEPPSPVVQVVPEPAVMRCPAHKPKFCNWVGRGKNYPCISQEHDCEISKEVYDLKNNTRSAKCIVNGPGQPCMNGGSLFGGPGGPFDPNDPTRQNTSGPGLTKHFAQKKATKEKTEQKNKDEAYAAGKLRPQQQLSDPKSPSMQALADLKQRQADEALANELNEEFNDDSPAAGASDVKSTQSKSAGVKSTKSKSAGAKAHSAVNKALKKQ